jgi:hypothetical protein
VRLSRGARADDGIEHVRRNRKARIARLEADDARSFRLGSKQLFPDLDDLAE